MLIHQSLIKIFGRSNGLLRPIVSDIQVVDLNSITGVGALLFYGSARSFFPALRILGEEEEHGSDGDRENGKTSHTK